MGSSLHRIGARCANAFLVLSVCTPVAVAQVPNLVFSSAADNDLYTSAVDTFGVNYARYNSPLQAVSNAPNGSGVMILADGYPEFTTTIQQQVVNEAAARNLRLYVEYPDSIPGLSIGSTFQNSVNRVVADSNSFFGDNLRQWDILDTHEATFVGINTTVSDADQHLRLARVAGFNTAVYQYSGITPLHLLFEHSHSGVEMLVSTTKMSNFVTGRYMPNDRWQSAWSGVLGWLDPAATETNLEWTPVLSPTYSRDEPLSPSALQDAMDRGIQWYSNARQLLHPDWYDEYLANSPFPDLRIHRPWTDPANPNGDGFLGILEGTANPIYDNGEQAIRWYVRGDNVGPSAMAYALQGLASDSEQSRTIAHNLVNHLNDPSFPLASGGKSDPTNPAYGMVGWNETAPFNNTYWSEVVGRAALNQIAAASALQTDEWDADIVTTTLAAFRLTGTTGFWGTNAVTQGQLDASGWEAFHDRAVDNLRPHYESSKWAPFLWLYDKTGHQPLLDRTREGVSRVMAAYDAGTLPWTNGIQQERGRMLLALAWLVRADDTPQHRTWLNQVMGDLIASQDESGAIQEELGAPGLGQFPAPASNLAFGTNEAPVIQQNGDSASDLLYTTNFAFMGMIEAAAVTGDPAHQQAVNDLADFLVRIQTTATIGELDGAWVRAFDFDRWDYWGSDSDIGWGTLGTQGGWTQAEIVASLALVHMNTSLWELTANSKVNDVFDPILNQMFPGPFTQYDLNGDGFFDIDDWIEVFQPNMSRDLSSLGLTAGEAAALGDFNGNFVVDIFDFREFKDAYEERYGPGAFVAALSNVPEPASAILIVCLLACYVIGHGCTVASCRVGAAENTAS